MSTELPFKVRVHKFLISAVVSVYNENGDLIDERSLKPQAQLTALELDLKGIAAKLEDKGNAELQNKKIERDRLSPMQSDLGEVPRQSLSE